MNDDDTTKTIPLNAAAAAAINGAAGGNFAIGGAVTTLDAVDNREYVYGVSNAGTIQRLDVETIIVPGPATLSMLALSTLPLLRRRHGSK